MPRNTLLLDVAHVFCQRVQCREFSGTFEPANRASKQFGVGTCTVDLIAGRLVDPASALLPPLTREAAVLRAELAAQLSRHGFVLEDLSAATVTVRPWSGDGTRYDLGVTLVRDGRRIIRCIDTIGNVVPSFVPP